MVKVVICLVKVYEVTGLEGVMVIVIHLMNMD